MYTLQLPDRCLAECLRLPQECISSAHGLQLSVKQQGQGSEPLKQKPLTWFAVPGETKPPWRRAVVAYCLGCSASTDSIKSNKPERWSEAECGTPHSQNILKPLTAVSS